MYSNYTFNISFCTWQEYIENLQAKTGISGVITLIDLLSFLRKICSEYFERNSIMIGCVGKHFRMDKVRLFKRKYNICHKFYTH